jgi:hypothetical protein
LPFQLTFRHFISLSPFRRRHIISFTPADELFFDYAASRYAIDFQMPAIADAIDISSSITPLLPPPLRALRRFAAIDDFHYAIDAIDIFAADYAIIDIDY